VYPGPQAGAPLRVQAVLDGLRAGGYSQVEIVLRVADDDPSRIIPLVTEVIASKVDVLFAIGPAVVRAARSAIQKIADVSYTPDRETLPIVTIDLESDPVDTGWAASLAHPSGNITGVFMAFPDFASKWLGLLKDALPQLSHVAVVWDSSTGLFQKKAIEDAAKASKLALETIEVRTPSDLDGAFNSAKRGGADSLVMLSSPLVSANVRKEAELAILHCQ
jgi:putative ABC transport system substrate-binding protein